VKGEITTPSRGERGSSTLFLSVGSSGYFLRTEGRSFWPGGGFGGGKGREKKRAAFRLLGMFPEVGLKLGMAGAEEKIISEKKLFEKKQSWLGRNSFQKTKREEVKICVAGNRRGGEKKKALLFLSSRKAIRLMGEGRKGSKGERGKKTGGGDSNWIFFNGKGTPFNFVGRDPIGSGRRKKKKKGMAGL